MDHNYYDTVIVVADDSKAEHSTVPKRRGGKRTVAEVQYEMLAGRPFEYTQEVDARGGVRGTPPER